MTGLGNIDDVYKHYLKVIDENQQLKELLKECKEHLCHHYCQITVGKLEKKIEEVLK